MGQSRRLTNELQLKDMYLHGRRYTWCNEQEHAIHVELGMVLYNEDWNTAFPCCLLESLSTAASATARRCCTLMLALHQLEAFGSRIVWSNWKASRR